MKLDNIKEYLNFSLDVLSHPMSWVFGRADVSDSWNSEFVGLIKEHQFSERTEYTAKLGDTEVWTGNHPYASFSKVVRDGKGTKFSKHVPKRINVWRAWKKLNKECPTINYFELED